MFDPKQAADTVGRWSTLGVDLPKPLTKAVETFELLRYVEVAHQPAVVLDGITSKNAEQRVMELAQRIAVAPVDQGRPGSGQGWAPVEQAKTLMVDSAASEVCRLARAAVPSIIEQLEPSFREHVDNYAGAAKQLPRSMDADALLKSGHGVIAAYETATQEAAALGSYEAWLASTAALDGGTGLVEEVLGILRPETTEQLLQLDRAAHKAKDAEAALIAVGPVYLAAVHAGVEFVLQQPARARSLRNRLTTVRPQRLTAV